MVRTLCALFALVFLLVAAGCDRSANGPKGIDLTGADWGKQLTLRDPEGRTRSLSEFRGKVVMLFFGFTQCPDVCPTALTRAVAVRKQLGADAEKLQVVFVSLDPERDTPALLREYTEAFDPSFLGLHGSAEETRRAAAEFHVYYEKVQTGSSYTLNHSTLTYLFDTRGRLRVALAHNLGVSDYVSDVQWLLNESN